MTGTWASSTVSDSRGRATAPLLPVEGATATTMATMRTATGAGMEMMTATAGRPTATSPGRADSSGLVPAWREAEERTATDVTISAVVTTDEGIGMMGVTEGAGRPP